MTEEQHNNTEAEKENTAEELEISNRDTSKPYPEKKTTEEVRQGHTGDHVRYILAISFIGALAALFALYWLMRSESGEDAAEANERVRAQTRVDETLNPSGAENDRTGAAVKLSRPDGEPAGTVNLVQTPNGVLLTATLEGLPPGEHAFHIHETGACEPDFGAAGGHFAPLNKDHGILIEGGPHAGDMPNIHVGADGALKIEILNRQISLKTDSQENILDEDGSAIVIHRGADDYRTQPSGEAGDRIACGVIEGGTG